VDHWLADAESILGVARASWDASNSEMVIIRHWAGGLEIKDGVGWSLFGLQAACGAKAVYRVTRSAKRLRVEAVSGSQSRLFEEELATRPFPFRSTNTAALLLHA
jgi:hypothetical protein